MLLAGEIVAQTFAKAGYDVKISSAHGMSKRGGSICSHIRIGKKLYSPLISRGRADILVGMELLEVCRWVEYLKKRGLAILLDREIYPPSLATSQSNRYPKDLKKRIAKSTKRVIWLTYAEIVKDLKDIKTINMFILGVLSSHFSLKKGYWLEAIREKVPLEVLNLNLTAFELGRKKIP